uniref:Adhesion G protein-coupled receptor G4a n=1 Tax=Gadus morhua TaxID=8049 RepID=A0A8C5BYQ5_GADMO
MARSPPIIMLWLWLQSSMYLQGSNIHGNPSLWGKKAEFQIKPCMWQLEPGLSVPELEELSVCVLLRLTVITEWTAFAYKAPGNPAVELGLEGDDQHITAVLFGARWPLNESLSSKVWQSVCLTWSAASRHLRLYVNGTRRLDQAVDPPVSGRLAPNGTLTLAWPHSVDQNGTVWREDGKTLMGGIGLFRMWAREWRAEEIMLLGCVEGDVVSWDARHWNHRSPASCPPKEDTSLHCEWSSYEIKMWAYIKHSNTSDATNSSLESITRHWMESIFPQNFSVQHVSVLSQSRRCLAGDNPAALYIQLPKKSKEFGNFTFDYCFLSEVLVSISPKKSVELVQADIRMKLEPEFSYDSLTLRTDIHDLSIQPVAPLYTMTEPPPIVSESPRPATDKTFSFPTMSTDSTTEGPKSCPEETLESIYGVYLWPETFTFGPQFMKCQRPFYGVAFRVCKFDIDSDMTSWEDPDMTYCEPHMNISDLHDWNVTAENAMDMVQTIQRLLFYELVYGSGSDAELSASDMVTVMGKLDDVVDVSVVTAELSNDIFLIISLILIPRRDMAPVSNMVLKLTERIGDKAVFSGDLFNVAFPKMAVSMINVQPKNFRGITFCVTNYADGMIPELMVNESFAEPIPGTVASIALPAELKNQLAADGNKTRFQFQFYGVQDLFNKTASGSPVQDSDQPIGRPAGPEPAVPAQHLDVQLRLRPVHPDRGAHALLPAGVLHLDGAGGTAHVLCPHQGLQRVRAVLHPQTLRGGLGCWIQSDVHFYVTVAGFILLVVLGNTGVFVVVLIQIRRMRTNKPLGKPAAGGSAQDLRAAASLTVLLGLTWLSAFFAVGPGRTVMLYVFCILNSLQGFFIFVFHCLTKENVRKQWRTRLTFDRFKPNDSDWSRSTSRPKQEPNSHSMGSVDTSSIIKASEFSSTTESLPVHPGSEGAGLLLQVAQPASTPNNIKTNTSVSWSNQ